MATDEHGCTRIRKNLMYYLGLDLGQKRDHSAVVVVERVDRQRAFQGTGFEKLLVRYVERMPLGMPYPGVVERVREIVRSDELPGGCAIAVDATGVGAPVVDMLRARLGCDLMAVTITGGDRAASNGSVPKRDLMAGVQVLLEKGQLRIGKLKEAGRLARGLGNMRTTMSSAGRVRMGADGCGEHDDLVIALALACWRAKGRKPNDWSGGGRLF
jgi:phage FluMu gp28-like protein